MRADYALAAVASLLTVQTESFVLRRSPSGLGLAKLIVLNSDWGSFQALDDDELFGKVDKNTYAEEEDSQEFKAEIGSSLEAPVIERPADPISVPAGRWKYFSIS